MLNWSNTTGTHNRSLTIDTSNIIMFVGASDKYVISKNSTKRKLDFAVQLSNNWRRTIAEEVSITP